MALPVSEFFNRLLRCFVLYDLKNGDIGKGGRALYSLTKGGITTDDRKQQLHGFLHGLNADIFISAMEIVPSGAQIGARQSHERKARAVSTAADWADYGRDVQLPHGFCCIGDQMHVGQDLFLQSLF